MSALTVIFGSCLVVIMLFTTGYCTTIEVSAPVSPVEAGGILSLHCQIRDLSDDMEVKILRTVGGKTERLSADKDIKSEAGDRVFLAIRTMFDGTTVYFLSIMEVTVDDGGRYFCQVVKEEATATTILAVDSIEIGIMHFPDETEPICETNQPTTILSGTEMILNCSSTKSNPQVDIKWSRTGTDTTIPKSEYGVGAERVYSFIKIRPSVADDQVIFMCQISSPYFPGKVQTCHIGPIKVSRNKNEVEKIPSTQSIHSPKGSVQNTPRSHIPAVEAVPTDCEAICSTLSTPVIYWVIATISAAILSFIFLIIGMVLLIKMCNIRTSVPMEDSYACSPPLHDKIYVELETKKPRDKLYMALATRERPPIPSMFTTTGSSTLDNSTDNPTQTYILHK